MFFEESLAGKLPQTAFLLGSQRLRNLPVNIFIRALIPNYIDLFYLLPSKRKKGQKSKTASRLLTTTKVRLFARAFSSYDARNLRFNSQTANRHLPAVSMWACYWRGKFFWFFLPFWTFPGFSAKIESGPRINSHVDLPFLTATQRTLFHSLEAPARASPQFTHRRASKFRNTDAISFPQNAPSAVPKFQSSPSSSSFLLILGQRSELLVRGNSQACKWC